MRSLDWELEEKSEPTDAFHAIAVAMTAEAPTSAFRVLHVRTPAFVREFPGKEGQKSPLNGARSGPGAESGVRRSSWSPGSKIPSPAEKSAGVEDEALVGAVEARLREAGAEVVACPDVFQAMAMIVGGDGHEGESKCLWDAVIVRTRDLDPEDEEFFGILSRMRGGPEVVVYRGGADGGLLERLERAGGVKVLAKARAERWVERRSDEATKPRSDEGEEGRRHEGTEARRHEAEKGQQATGNRQQGEASHGATKPRSDEGEEGRRHEGAEGKKEKATEARTHQEEEIAGQGGAEGVRVPWKQYEGRPVRRKPGSAEAGSKEATSADRGGDPKGNVFQKAGELEAGGKKAGEQEAGDARLTSPAAESSAPAAESFQPGEASESAKGSTSRARREEPLLSEAELRELLGDDVAAFVPRMRDAGGKRGDRGNGESDAGRSGGEDASS
ncbi:MAG: hypothetical protein J5J06_02820 [Phycisphaerae bacterium]|nr:hypothetical protein [Phycisphaerae bacterium]